MANKLFLSGWVTKTPKLGFTDKGDPMCPLDMKEVEKGRNGKDWITYHHLMVFGPLAEDVSQWREGDFVWIEGSLRYRKSTGGATVPTVRVMSVERLVEAGATPAAPADPAMQQGGGADEGGEIPW